MGLFLGLWVLMNLCFVLVSGAFFAFDVIARPLNIMTCDSSYLCVAWCRFLPVWLVVILECLIVKIHRSDFAYYVVQV